VQGPCTGKAGSETRRQCLHTNKANSARSASWRQEQVARTAAEVPVRMQPPHRAAAKSAVAALARQCRPADCQGEDVFPMHTWKRVSLVAHACWFRPTRGPMVQAPQGCLMREIGSGPPGVSDERDWFRPTRGVR